MGGLYLQIPFAGWIIEYIKTLYYFPTLSDVSTIPKVEDIDNSNPEWWNWCSQYIPSKETVLLVGSYIGYGLEGIILVVFYSRLFKFLNIGNSYKYSICSISSRYYL